MSRRKDKSTIWTAASLEGILSRCTPKVKAKLEKDLLLYGNIAFKEVKGKIIYYDICKATTNN